MKTRRRNIVAPYNIKKRISNIGIIYIRSRNVYRNRYGGIAVIVPFPQFLAYYRYSDFVAAAGVGDDLESFVFQNWGLAENSNFKVDLLIPVEADATSVTVNLYTGDLADNAATFTPVQLGATVPGAELKISYTGAGEEGEAAVGICGNGAEWYVGTNCLASVGMGIDNYYQDTYENFVEFTGITAPVSTYIFQNWGLLEGTECSIDLILPVV